MLSGEVERCTWAQSDGLLREQRPSQFDVLLTAVSVQQTLAFLLSFARKFTFASRNPRFWDPKVRGVGGGGHGLSYFCDTEDSKPILAS